MTSTVDNCCQRAKVHRLVTLPEQSCKMSWSCCGIFFSGVCVNFEYLEIWIHYFSNSNSAPHYFSKSNSAHHYFSKSNSAPHYFSKSNSAHHYFSKSNQLLIIFLSPIQRIIIFLSPIQRIIIFLSPIQVQVHVQSGAFI